MAILPSADHWWTYRNTHELGKALAEAGHLIVGYGMPWLAGELQPPGIPSCERKKEQVMPAIDQCENQVIRALEKAGWLITHQPFAIRIDKSRAGYVYADLRLRRATDNQTVIVVEVKCFDSTRTHLDEFYHAVGQYVSYRNALEQNDMAIPVYLSVPASVYATFFQVALIAAVVDDMRIKLIVIDLDKEEIMQWTS